MRILFLLVLILAVPAAMPAADGPCAVLTKAEVQEAPAGIAVAEGAVNANNKAVCDYKSDTGAAIGISLVPKGPADSADKMVAELKKHKITAVIVPGIGDGAYASSPGYGMQQIGAFKGSKHVIATVLIFGAPEAKSKAAAEKLVRKAVSKL